MFFIVISTAAVVFGGRTLVPSISLGNTIDVRELESIADDLSNTESYALLFKLWETKISPQGPPSSTKIGRFTLGQTTQELWDVHAVGLSNGVGRILTEILDSADTGSKIFIRPVMLICVTLTKRYWVCVVDSGIVVTQTKKLNWVRLCANTIGQSCGGSTIAGINVV